MPAYLNRGATYAEEPQLPDDPLIDLLAQTNAKVEHFDLSPDHQSIAYISADSGGYDLWVCDADGANNRRLVAMYPEECLNPPGLLMVSASPTLHVVHLQLAHLCQRGPR